MRWRGPSSRAAQGEDDRVWPFSKEIIFNTISLVVLPLAFFFLQRYLVPRGLPFSPEETSC
jgi:hypothetical protein